MGQIEAVNVEIVVVLGRASLPVQQFLHMGRGAVIVLDAGLSEEVWVLANGHPIARGIVQLNGDVVTVVLTSPADVNDYWAALS